MPEASTTAAGGPDRDFTHAVQLTISRLQTLLGVLDEERRALAGQAADALQAVVPRKLEALAELEQAVVYRDRLQQAAGLPPGLDGGERYVAARLPALTADWRRLLQLCREVDQSNAANGQLALQSARQAREALGILTGRDHTPAAYGPGNRRPRPAISSHSLGRV
jgi:flagellar biosynthesis/type III secretory pathway chaperone